MKLPLGALAVSIFLFLQGCGIETEITNEIIPIPPQVTLKQDSTLLNGEVISLKKDSSLKFEVEYRDSLNQSDQSVVVLYQSSDSSVVGVDGQGNITAKQNGDAWVYVSVFLSNSNIPIVKDSFAVMVQLDLEQHIFHLNRIGPSTIGVGDSLTYSALITNLSGDTLTLPFHWRLLDSTVGDISTSGLFISKKEGQSVIYFTDGVMESRRDTITVQSTKSPYIEITSPSQVIEGGHTTITPVYYDNQGNPSAQTFTWTLSDSTLASVDGAGLFTAISTGLVEVTVSSGGISESVFITIVINSNKVTGVAVSGPMGDVNVGDNISLIASALNAAGDTLLGKDITWHTSDSTILNLDASGKGVTKKPGMVNITAASEGVTSLAFSLTVISNSKSGTFIPRPGGGYDLEGTGTLRKNAQGEFEVHLGSDFRSSNGPGLVVVLSKTNTVTAGSIDLGALKSTTGEQTYPVNQSISIDEYSWIIIHCQPFDVSFGYAELQ